MKNLEIAAMIGAALALLGSFLPWETQGDLISYHTYGIRLFPQISDSSGSLAVLLTIAFSFLILWPPRSLKNPQLWILFFASILMAAAILFILRWLAHRIMSVEIIGAPSINIGLILVVMGSALMLIYSIVTYRRSKNAG